VFEANRSQRGTRRVPSVRFGFARILQHEVDQPSRQAMRRPVRSKDAYDLREPDESCGRAMNPEEVREGLTSTART